MTLATITPERRLVNLAGRLSQQEGTMLDNCRLMGVDPDQHFPRSGRSAFNSAGSPLQLNLSACRQGIRVRLLADPQTTAIGWHEKRQRALLLLNHILDGKKSDPTLAQTCHAIANIFLPQTVNAAISSATKSGIGFGMEMGSPGLAIYGYGPWSTDDQAWCALIERLPDVLPAPQPLLAHVTTLRSVGRVHGIGMAGSKGRNARIKLYWKLIRPTRIDILGLPLNSLQPFVDFLHLLSQESGFTIDTLYFCSGFDWQTGRFRDFKIDACCCSDCLALSQAKLIHTMEQLAHHHGIHPPDLRPTIYRQEARCSLLGLGIDYKGEMRLNTYLSPCTPPPMPTVDMAAMPGHENSMTARVAQSLERAIAFLTERQMANGAFLSLQSPAPTLDPESVEEISPFVTSNILYSLQFVPGPTAATMRHRGRGFLLAEMGPPGCWRYWSALYRTDLPADLDDSSCAALVLDGKVPTEHFVLDRQVFLKQRNKEGLFYTWMGAYQGRNDVDSVVNANVLAVLGDAEETKPVCQYLIKTLERGEEQHSYWYYLSDVAFYYALSRAIFLGVTGLMPTRQIILTRLIQGLQQGGLPKRPLETALTLCTLLNLDCDHADLMGMLSNRLLQWQNPQGGWQKSAYYGGQTPPGPKTIFFGSEALVTGFCIEALLRSSHASAIAICNSQ